MVSQVQASMPCLFNTKSFRFNFIFWTCWQCHDFIWFEFTCCLCSMCLVGWVRSPPFRPNVCLCQGVVCFPTEARCDLFSGQPKHPTLPQDLEVLEAWDAVTVFWSFPCPWYSFKKLWTCQYLAVIECSKVVILLLSISMCIHVILIWFIQYILYIYKHTLH